MPTVPAIQNGAARSLEEEFLDLVCADEELLRAEFDAIIAQEWGGRRPPPARPRAAGGTGGPHPRHTAWRGSSPSQRRPRHPGAGGWRRQRSPPRHTRANAPNQRSERRG